MNRLAFLALSAAATMMAGWTMQAYGAFMDSFAEARLMGMGGVGAAFSNGAASLFTNPAGLALLKDADYPRSASAAYAPIASNLDDGNDLTQSMLAYAQAPGIGLAWKRLQAGRLYSENILAVGYGWEAATSGDEGKRRLLTGVKAEMVSWNAAPTALRAVRSLKLERTRTLERFGGADLHTRLARQLLCADRICRSAYKPPRRQLRRFRTLRAAACSIPFRHRRHRRKGALGNGH